MATTGISIDEHATLQAARERGSQLGTMPSPELSALLRWMAASREVKTVVAIGSGAGVTGLALLDGMPERSVLTSIERDVHRHEMARSTFDAAGVGNAVRSIQGDPAVVLGRLGAAGYDLAVSHDCDLDLGTHLDEVVRLLRPGGVFVAAPLGDKDASQALLQAVAVDERFITAPLPLDGGVVLGLLA